MKKQIEDLKNQMKRPQWNVSGWTFVFYTTAWNTSMLALAQIIKQKENYFLDSVGSRLR